MRSRLFRVAPALLPLLFTFVAGAQQLLKPQTIRFEGLNAFSADELLGIAGVTKGQTYTSDFLNETAQKLMATGAFEKVGFKFDGIDLTFLIRESSDLYPVTVENLPIETGAPLDARLHQLIPLYHGKVPSEGTLLDDVRNALQKMLKDEGLDAKVTFIPAGDNANKKATAIKFRIESPAVEVGDIQLSGVSDSMLPAVNQAIKLVASSFDARASQKSLAEQVASVYRFNGYAAATVQAAPAGKPTLVEGSIRVPFTVSVNEGRAYKLGTVQLASGLPLNSAEVDKLSTAFERDKGSANYLRAMVGAVNMRLKGKGYLDCKVTPNAFIDESAGVVNYTIDAVTGPQYHLGLLKFDNVSDSLRSLLMRSWQMMPGDPFDESYVANFILIAQKNDPVLQRTLAGVKATYDAHADPDTHEVNVVIRLSRQ